MISINADEASEDEQPGILHFNGHFLMKSSDWQLTAEEATVYGRPDRPDRVYLEGSPARFLVNRKDHTGQDQIKAAALVVEYLRDANLLVMSGGATLMLGDEVIRSAHIEYDISTNRYQAGGDDGVMIEVPPID
ncbi:MAG: LptA/OstA family protein [Xanthomonadales bacterium]|nr:LptA/OstA family protein [Xanthomonadales bacterium]